MVSKQQLYPNPENAVLQCQAKQLLQIINYVYVREPIIVALTSQAVVHRQGPPVAGDVTIFTFCTRRVSLKVEPSLSLLYLWFLIASLLKLISLSSISLLDSWLLNSWWLCWSLSLATVGRTEKQSRRIQAWMSSRSSLSLVTLHMMESAPPGIALLRAKPKGIQRNEHQAFEGKALPPAVRKGSPTNHRYWWTYHFRKGMSPSTTSCHWHWPTFSNTTELKRCCH